MSDLNNGDRRPYLAAIPTSDRVLDRLRRVTLEAKQLEILLRTAREIEAAEQAATPVIDVTEVGE